jgi:dihydropteroate synthase
MSVSAGAHLVRVHDVTATKKAILVADAILTENKQEDTSISKIEKNQHYVF